MASIVFKNRSIPIAWYMGEGRKGHFSEIFHIGSVKTQHFCDYLGKPKILIRKIPLFL